MREDITEEEAVRRIVSEGQCADYVDVANAVQQRFGHKIGSAKVEEVVHSMKTLTESPSESPPTQHALNFVESMGGFTAARAAIDRLEQSLRKLM